MPAGTWFGLQAGMTRFGLYATIENEAMLQQCYVSGFERQQFRVLGVELAPLTLGHISVLALTANRLIVQDDDAAPSIEDVASFIYVCSFPKWEDALLGIKSGKAVDHIAEWKAEGLDDKRLAEASRAIKEYYGHYSACPQNKFTAQPERVPWWWNYAEFLQSEMHWPEDDAWGCIVSDAFAYFACWAVRHGNKDILTEHERAVQDAVRSGKTVKQLFEEGKL